MSRGGSAADRVLELHGLASTLLGMPTNGLYIQAAGKIAERIPGVRALPIVRLIMAGEVLVLGKHHLDRLSPAERTRIVALLRQARGRPKNLNHAQQAELTTLMEKLEPRLFLAEAGEKLSPVGLPSPLRSKIVGAGERARGGTGDPAIPWPKPRK